MATEVKDNAGVDQTPEVKKDAQAGSTSTASSEPKRTRTVLSPAERIAKLEAELAAARESAAGRAAKKLERLQAQRTALVEKRDALDEKIKAVEGEIKEAEALANGIDEASEDEAPEGDES